MRATDYPAVLATVRIGKPVVLAAAACLTAAGLAVLFGTPNHLVGGLLMAAAVSVFAVGSVFVDLVRIIADTLLPR